MKFFYRLLILSTFLLPLSAFAQSINRDTSKSPAITAPAHFFAGLAFNSFSNGFSSSSDELNNAKSTTSTMPGLNLGVDIPLDQSAQWIFRAEAGITSNKDNFNYQYTVGAVSNYNEVLSFKQTIVNITPQVILNVVKTNNLNVYLSTGINIGIRNYRDKIFTTTTTYTASGTTSTGANPGPDFKSTTFCVPAKVGIVVAKHINVYAAYNVKTSLNNDSDFAINETSYAIGVNYIFGSK